MAKAVKQVRGKFFDEKYLGPEPDLSKSCTTLELMEALNWYNYFYSTEDAKKFTIDFLKGIKHDKEEIKKLSQVSNDKFSNSIGWICRMLDNGASLPENEVKGVMVKIRALINSQTVVVEEPTEDVPAKPVVNIQERVASKAGELIADLEEQLDILCTEGRNNFDAAKWFRDQNIKPQIAQKIADYYKPLYSELFDALGGKDKELNEAYASWKKPRLKAYVEFVRLIVSAAENRVVVVKAVRKPRKKKEKPASVLVAKLQYLEEDTTLGLKSVKPTEVIGANQLWVYNTKYRSVSVYNAMGPTGLGVKGTSLLGFDEKASITKRLRKPEAQLKSLIDAGKINLRRYMDTVKCKPKAASGRLNKDTILLRVIR